MGLVYDLRGLSGVTITRPRVVGVLQMVLEPTLAVSRVRMGQLRRMRWRMGQGCGYVCMTHGFSGRDMIWYVYAANWTYDTHIPVLNVWTWPRGDIPSLVSTNEDVSFLRGVDCDILTQGLIGFIEYSYHQCIPSFPEAQLKRTLDATN
jgi:hypothetical protein